MKKICIGLIGLLLLCGVGLANATPVTRYFSMTVTGIYLSDPSYPEVLPYVVAVGDTSIGSITYDNSNIPTVGAYSIQQPSLGGADWFFYIPFYPFWYPGAWDGYQMSGLTFANGFLTSFWWDCSPDLWPAGLDGARVSSYGFGFDGGDWVVIDPTLGISDAVRWTISGSVNIIPEPTSMLLLGLGLMGMAGMRKKFRQ